MMLALYYRLRCQSHLDLLHTSRRRDAVRARSVAEAEENAREKDPVLLKRLYESFQDIAYLHKRRWGLLSTL